MNFFESEAGKLTSSDPADLRNEATVLPKVVGRVSRDPGCAYPVPHSMTPVRASGIVVVLQRPHEIWEAALLYGLTVQTLLWANPEVVPDKVLNAGQRLSIPHAPPAPCIGGRYVILRKGESLESTAAEHGVCLETLHLANPALVNPARVAAGQVVCVPQKGSLHYHFGPPAFGFLPFE